jgi:FkbM family methyltransferase
MKNNIKNILKILGLLSFARNLANKLRKNSYRKYKNINKWYLKYRGLSLVYDTSDWYSTKWFFPRYDEGRIHEPIATDIFIDQIKSDSVILDIGGHLGYFSCIAGNLAKTGSVYVFEVDPKCLNFIHNNLKLNNLENVQVNNYAVSDTKEIIKIPHYEKPNPFLMINSNLSDNFIEVESVIIDDFLAQYNINPDFIKIDIEGAEWKALNGMKKTLENRNATILVEIHVDNLRDNFNTSYKKIIKLLMNYGYSIHELEHRGSDDYLRIVDLDTELKGNTMILCRKSN